MRSEVLVCSLLSIVTTSEVGKTTTLWHVVEGPSASEVIYGPQNTKLRKLRLKAGNSNSKNGEAWYRGHCTVLYCSCVAVAWLFDDCSIDSITLP